MTHAWRLQRLSRCNTAEPVIPGGRRGIGRRRQHDAGPDNDCAHLPVAGTHCDGVAHHTSAHQAIPSLPHACLPAVRTTGSGSAPGETQPVGKATAMVAAATTRQRCVHTCVPLCFPCATPMDDQATGMCMRAGRRHCHRSGAAARLMPLAMATDAGRHSSCFHLRALQKLLSFIAPVAAH